MSKKNIVIIGRGGHAQVIKEAVEQCGQYSFKGFLGKSGDREADFTDDKLNIVKQRRISRLAMGIGNISYDWYQSLTQRYLKEGFDFPVLQEGSSSVASTVVLGKGCCVLQRAVIKSYAVVDDFVLINSLAVVSHNCHVGKYVHISIGAMLGGDCQVGENSFIGMNATVLQRVTIGKNVIVGAGSIVLKDVPDHAVVVGNPAKIIRWRNEKQ